MSTADSFAPSGVALAVMPFENLSHPQAHDYFTRGFVDDVIIELSRFNELTVMAGPDAKDLPAEVEYTLSGTLRRDERELRLGLQMKEARSGRVIWADRLQSSIERVFDLQDQIVAQVVSAVSGRINASRLAAARRRPAKELQAYDAWLRGLDLLKQGTLESDKAARDLFERALASDPAFARAHLGLSLTYFNEWSCQLWECWDQHEQKAFAHAEQANALDPNDHFVHMVLGRVLIYRRDFDRGEAHVRRSLALNRNDPDCLVQVSLALTFLGQHDEARETFARAVHLNPHHPLWYHAYGTIVAFAQDRFEETLEHARRVPLDIMVDLSAHMAVAYAHTGQIEKARVHVEHYIRQFREKILGERSPEPGEALRWLRHVNPYKHLADEERLTLGMYKAGLPGVASPSPAQSHEAVAIFRKAGSLWQASFAGKDVHLPHVKGFADIAALLASPAREVHCLELMNAPAPHELPGEAAGIETIDLRAKAAYEARLSDLEEALAESEAHHDLARAASARAERDALVSHLAQSLGLGGRPRKLDDAAERARAAVTQRIRGAIKRLEKEHPALAGHLEKAIRTGTYCTYSPGQPIDWRL